MKSLAIIGTGIAGLAAAHFLHERFALTIYEQNAYPGGHSNTIFVDEGERRVPIDTGFMVFNHVTYPGLTRLFRDLDVAIKPTNMSFSVQHGPSGVEFNGGSLNLLFGQRRNLVNPRHWRMLWQINRFNSEAVAALADPRFAELSLADYVALRGYGCDMLERYLIPMSSAVWSTPPEKMRDFPAVTLLRFWHNHGFLGLHTQHPWFTVVDGAQAYVSKMIAPFRERILLGRQVVGLARNRRGATLRLQDGSEQSFDKVILACHGDQALGLLSDPTLLESRLLGPFHAQANVATLHTDEKFMPRRRRCWAAWNYRISGVSAPGAAASTHYWMNRLQGVSERQNYFVSLNCHEEIAPEKVLRRIDYEHPLFSLGAIAAQQELPRLNRLSPAQSTYFAGAWFKYGFHEDGFVSGLECARAVTGEPLWT